MIQNANVDEQVYIFYASTFRISIEEQKIAVYIGHYCTQHCDRISGLRCCEIISKLEKND